jgi:F-type H+-transporting ATPase subunit gamma
MQMVAASRMRKAQDAVESSRPFSEKIREVLVDLGAAAPAGEGALHPLLERRPERTVAMVLMTSDRGLAGGFNTNVIRLATNYLLQDGDRPVRLYTLGRKGRDFMVRYGRDVVSDYSGLGDTPDLSAVTPVAREVIDGFTARDLDSVYLAYTEYVNTLNQTPRLVKLLPIEPPESDEADEARRGEQPTDYLFEPDPRQLLGALLPRYVEVQLYQALLESKASEHSARMVAMRNATDNAGEIVDGLTLEYNKARQASITTQIIEVAGGAAALEG